MISASLCDKLFRHRLLLPLTTVLVLLIGSSSTANAVPQTHDGFFLQMDLGIGGMGSLIDDGHDELEISGGAGEFSLAVGGAVTENLILAGHLWAMSAVEPTVKFNGRSLGQADATLTLSGIGLNVTNYFMPSNIYVSITPSITSLSLESDGTTGEADTGFGIRFAVGKEWWVSDEWGLGLNGQLAYSSNDDNGGTWGTAWVGLAFSATFN